MALLRGKIPDKTREKLEWAFGKAFAIVFTHGVGVIEKTYNSKKLGRSYISRELAMLIDDDLSAFDNASRASKVRNMLITTIEGAGLGALGIGLPDIVLFVAMLLRSVYETALQYGFTYDKPEDKLFILTMLETAMLSGKDWVERDAAVELMAECPEATTPTEGAINEQLQRTAAAFTTDLLVLKFIQGLPVVGLVGGLGNPVYYRKVMSYVELKYRRRYVKTAIKRMEENEDCGDP